MTHSWLGGIVVFVVGILTAGCGSTETSNQRLASTALASGEAVAIFLTRSDFDPTLDKGDVSRLEGNVTSCVGKALRRAPAAVRIMPADELRNVAFPAATDIIPPWPWPELLDESLARERLLTAHGVRYVIAVTVTASQQWERSGDGVGVAKWSTSSMEAEIFDLRHRRPAGSVTARAYGSSGGGLVFLLWVPIPYFHLSFPESRACNVLGEEIAKFLAGEESSPAGRARRAP